MQLLLFAGQKYYFFIAAQSYAYKKNEIFNQRLARGRYSKKKGSKRDEKTKRKKRKQQRTTEKQTKGSNEN